MKPLGLNGCNEELYLERDLGYLAHTDLKRRLRKKTSPTVYISSLLSVELKKQSMELSINNRVIANWFYSELLEF